MTKFDLGKHGLVDVESLIDYLNLLTCLLEIPLFELVKQFLVNIVRPVIYLQDAASVIGATEQHKSGQYEVNYLFHLEFAFSAARAFLRLMTIRRARMPTNRIVIIGRSSGVRPPLRASV